MKGNKKERMWLSQS